MQKSNLIKEERSRFFFRDPNVSVAQARHEEVEMRRFMEKMKCTLQCHMRRLHLPFYTIESLHELNEQSKCDDESLVS